MTFDFPGYELNFIQKKQCKDGSAHKFTVIYKFFSPVTKYFYILNAEYHDGDVFAIKFYCKKDRGSEFKFSKIVNKGDLGNILITCAKAVPILLEQYPTASFGFIGSRTVDINKKVEDFNSNQRFRTYKYIIKEKFGTQTFEHVVYPQISGYLLLNRSSSENLQLKERAIVQMVTDTYVYLPDLIPPEKD